MMVLFILFLSLVLLTLWMFHEASLYEINRYPVKIRKKLHQSFKVLHLTDIHFYKKHSKMESFFDRLADEEFDFVLISGDIIDSLEGIPVAGENLKKLKAKNGIYAVLGNHDYYDYYFGDVLLHNFPGQRKPRRIQKVDLLLSTLKEAGIRVLRNETLAFSHQGDAFLLHGLDDPTTGKANIRETLKNYDPEKINILLTHSVDVFLDIGRNEIDLSFSGHSHGGQIRLPWIGAILTHTTIGKQYVSGIRRLRGAICSISRGLGCGRFLPVRLLCKPEVIVLEVYGR